MEKCITLLLKTMMCPWHSDWRSQAFLLFSSLFPCQNHLQEVSSWLQGTTQMSAAWMSGGLGGSHLCPQTSGEIQEGRNRLCSRMPGARRRCNGCKPGLFAWISSRISKPTWMWVSWQSRVGSETHRSLLSHVKTLLLQIPTKPPRSLFYHCTTLSFKQ